MNSPERILSAAELRSQWGWNDEDFVEAMRMGLPAYEPATKRALSADDITKLGELVTSGGTINARCKVGEVEKFKRDHPEIFPRGVKPKRPKRSPKESLRMSVEKVAEQWGCSADQIRRLVADGLLAPPEGAGPEGWFDRKALQEGRDIPTSNLEIFTAERAWEKTAGWKLEAIREFERTHRQSFEKEHLTSVPQVPPPSSPMTPVGSSGVSPRTDAKEQSPPEGGASQADQPTPATSKRQAPAEGGAGQADKPTPATATDSTRDAANARSEITREDVEAAVEVAVEMSRWWGKQPENGKRPMKEAIAYVKRALPHLCNKMSDTRLKMIASKANPKPVDKPPGRRN